jgi:hypothetical protein
MRSLFSSQPEHIGNSETVRQWVAVVVAVVVVVVVVVFMPGLFHLKMATMHAFWRAHVPDAKILQVFSSIFIIFDLKKQENSQAGFCQLHHSIHHAMWADVLYCWRLMVKTFGHVSMDSFMNTKPPWGSIVAMSKQMVMMYLPGRDFGDIQEEDVQDCDMCFKNHTL